MGWRYGCGDGNEADAGALRCQPGLAGVDAIDRARRVGAVLRDSEQVRNFTLQQWQQLGRRSLFDVMGAESDHFNLRISYVNALHDGQQLNANLLSLGRGVTEWLK